MTPINSITSLTLVEPPSCIAFCPTRPDLFIIGTYLLHQTAKPDNVVLPDEYNGDADSSKAEAQERSGSLIVYHLGNDGNTFNHILTQPTPDYAILDIQWALHPAQLGDLLAVATSTGLLVFYELNAQQELIHVATKRICDASILVLSLCWHPLRADIIGLTLSNGEVCLCQSTGNELWRDGGLSLTTVYQHSLETWMIAFAPSQDREITEVLSGGDDQILQRSSISNENECTLLWEDRRIHQAGVTAILPLTSDLILTGSYDDRLRLLSAPALGRRQVLAEVNLGGGVWRLKVLEGEVTLADGEGRSKATGAFPDTNKRSLLILASCMHAGTRVVRLRRSQDDGVEDEAPWSFDVLAKFEEHQSMNYGSDVQPADGLAVKSTVSTSFYDKLLCLWQFDVGGL